MYNYTDEELVKALTAERASIGPVPVRPREMLRPVRSAFELTSLGFGFDAKIDA